MAQHTPRYACSLDADGAGARLPQLRALTERLRGRQRHDQQVVLRFAADDGRTAELVEDFVRDEQQCCSFFDFDTARFEDEIVLEIGAPTQAAHLLDADMTAFDPDASDEQRIDGVRAARRGSTRPLTPAERAAHDAFGAGWVCTADDLPAPGHCRLVATGLDRLVSNEPGRAGEERPRRPRCIVRWTGPPCRGPRPRRVRRRVLADL